MKFLMYSSLICLMLSGCGRVKHIGTEPAFTPVDDSHELQAMTFGALPTELPSIHEIDRASLWHAGPASLLGDQRAVRRGDILTVVIEIDDAAEISNSSNRSRSGSEQLAIPELFGLPQRVDPDMPAGASLSNAVSLNSSAKSGGEGSVKRKEKLALRIAATVIQTMPNGVLQISGTQQVRVNFEMRELFVSGFVRPEDISRSNEITYDKIAGAQISYGGRGHISDVQQPRIGQQILDVVLPF